MNRAELEAKKNSGVVLSAEEEAFLAAPPSSEGEPNPETPPTPQPGTTPTDQGRYIGILEQTLREQNRQINELMAGRTAPAAPAAPPAPSPEQEKQDFYNEPVKTTRKIVTDALAEAIAPLNDFVRGLKIDGSPYANMMAKFKGDARFSQVLQDPHILATVEKIMERAELNEVNMQSAIVHASGLKTMGLLGTVVADPGGGNAPPAPNGNNPPAPPSAVLPPHVRPSAAPIPVGAPRTNNPARPPLSENARRIMREQGFKDENEYYTWLEMDAAEVANANFDKTPPRTPSGTR